MHPLTAYLLGLVGIVIFEEAIKLRAAHLQACGIHTFALVSLYGIFDLALIKPVFMWGVSAKGAEIFWLQASLLPALAMHVLTAAIYAFHFRQKPMVQFAICAVIHLLFKIAGDQIGVVSDTVWLASLVPLVAVTLWLVPDKQSADRGAWRPEDA